MAKMSKKMAKELTANINSMLVWSSSVTNAQVELDQAATANDQVARDKARAKMLNSMKWFNQAVAKLEKDTAGQVTATKFLKMSGEAY